MFPTDEIPAGALIVTLRGIPSGCPTRHTVQINDTLHIDEAGLIDGHINHSCAANSFVDSSIPLQPVIRAFHSIPTGSEITINYCASEDQLAEPFECICGNEDCYRIVRGYSKLTPDQRRELGSEVSPYLLEKYGVPDTGFRAPLPLQSLLEAKGDEVEPEVKS